MKRPCGAAWNCFQSGRHRPARRSTNSSAESMAVESFAVVETDDPADLLDAVSKFGPLLEYQIHPVVEIADWARMLQEGAEFRESIS